MALRSRPSTAALAVALWPCAFYFGCSLSMNLLTKALLTTYGWRSVYALGAAQNGFTLASLAVMWVARRVFASVDGGAKPANTHTPAKDALSEESTTSSESEGEAPSGNDALPRTDAPPDRAIGRSAARGGRLYGGDWLRQTKVVLPLLGLHLANVLLGFAGLRAVNLPMYVSHYCRYRWMRMGIHRVWRCVPRYLVLRRLVTLKIMLIEWLVLHKVTNDTSERHSRATRF